MKALSYFSIICCLFALSSCLKDSVSVPTTTYPVSFTYTPSKNPVITPVNGSWQWINTNSSEGGVTTPASTHSTVRLEFDADSTLKEFRNDTLIAHQNFAYLKNHQFEGSLTSDAVETAQTLYQVVIKNDTLNFNLVDVSDPSYGKYVRIK